MILRIATRDLIKSWKRSGAVVSAVTISVFLLLISFGYMDGFEDKFYTQMVRESGHLKITAPGYLDRLDLLPLKPNISVTESLRDSLLSIPNVMNLRPMIRSGALANSPERTLEMRIIATTPQALRNIYTRFENSIIEGRFIDGDNQVMIGTEAAKLLHVSAGDRLILLTSDVYGGMSAVEPEIVGIYRSLNDAENSQTVLTDLRSTQKLLALDGRVTEISIELDSHEDVDQALAATKSMLGDAYIVQSWMENQAGMMALLDISKIGMGILSGIILIVASLGMINTFLMSVLERLPEFGTLRAIGIHTGQLIRMVVFQGLVLGIVGTILGFILGLPVVYYFKVNPIDFGEAMQGFEGIDSLIWFDLLPETIVLVALLGITISVLASIYPAIYAGRKRPVDIMRDIV